MSEMLTDTELYAIRARAEAATPGPWRSLWDDDPMFMSSYFVATKGNASPWDETNQTVIAGTLLQTKATICHESKKWEEDADFIAHARTDIPDLLAHIDEQRAEIDHLKRALEWIAQSDCRGEGNSTFCWRWCPCWSNKDRSGHCTGTIIEASMKATEEASGE